MNKNLHFCFAFYAKRVMMTLISSVFCFIANAQMVGDNVFIQGHYVEIGVSPSGSYGTTTVTPTGYYPNAPTFTFWDPLAAVATSGIFLGFVADYGRDGWTVGTPPAFGDFFLPGDPQEGWAIQVGGVESDAYTPAFQSATAVTGYTGGLSGTNIAYSNSGGVIKGVWSGKDTSGGNNLLIRQTTSLDTNSLFYTVTVVLTNAAATPANNIFYLRTVDPDNDETYSGSYVTRNTITYQLPDPGNKVLVSARGDTYTNAYLGLGTKDCRAKCMIFDGGTLTPSYTFDSMWVQRSVGTYIYALGAGDVQDVGIGLLFNIGTLAAGDSTELTYAYILDSAYIDSAFSALSSTFLVNDSSFVSGDSINACSYPYDSVQVNIQNGGFYTWTWAPDSFIHTTSGVSNYIWIDSIRGTLVYTVVGINGAGGCDSQLFYVKIVHDTFDFTLNNHDTTICLAQSVTGSVTGPPVINYAWSPGNGVSNTAIPNPIITPTITTTYTVTGSTPGGCAPKWKSFIITVADPPKITVDSPYVKTCAGIPVQLHVYPTPAASYTYSWTPPTYLSGATIQNPIVTPALPGDITYTITVTSSILSTCSAIDTIHVHTVPDNFIINNDTIICHGNSVVGNITGGSNEFHWLWTPPTGINNDTLMNATITPTITSSYTLTASYAACPNIVHSFNIEVDYAAPIKNITDTFCLGYSVTNINYAVYDSGYYHYQWTPSTYVSNDTIPNPVITPTLTGTITYVITVSPHDALCAVNDTVNFLVLPNDFTIVNRDTFICNGQSVVANIIGGSNLFHWLWTPPAGVSDTVLMDATLTPTVTTIYTLTATYPTCPLMQHSLSLAVDYPAPVTTIIDTICIGGSVNTINLTSPYSGYYSYNWTPAAYLSNDTIPNPIITPTVAGVTTTYTVAVQPMAPACIIYDNISIIVLPNKFPITPIDTTVCAGNIVQVVSTGSNLYNSLFNFQWIPTTGIRYSQIIDPIIATDTTAFYVLSISRQGCVTVYDTLILNVQPEPTIFVGNDRFVCQFDTLHLGTLVTPAFNGYNYKWSPSLHLDSSNTANVVFISDSSVEEHVTVFTSAGCTATDSLYITVRPGNFAGLDTNYMELCPRDTTHVIGFGGVSFQWFPDLFLQGVDSGTYFTLAPVTSQTYTVIATSIYGCKDTLSYTVIVKPAAVISLGASITLYPGQTCQLNAIGNCTSYTWFPPSGLSNPYVSNPVASPEFNTTYFVTGTTENGCVAKDSITIIIDPQTLLALPNAFTPGNGTNAKFKIIKNGLATLNYFRIFNRWGNLIYESNNIEDGWDGTYKGTPQPYDVYMYDVEAVTSTGDIFHKKGNITLIR